MYFGTPVDVFLFRYDTELIDHTLIHWILYVSWSIVFTSVTNHGFRRLGLFLIVGIITKLMNMTNEDGIKRTVRLKLEMMDEIAHALKTVDTGRKFSKFWLDVKCNYV